MIVKKYCTTLRGGSCNKLHCWYCFWYYSLYSIVDLCLSCLSSSIHKLYQANVVHCGASMSELYGVIVLHILFKALPPKVLNVYTGNEIII